MPSWMPSFFFLPNKPPSKLLTERKFLAERKQTFLAVSFCFCRCSFHAFIVINISRQCLSYALFGNCLNAARFFFCRLDFSVWFFFSIHCSPTCTRALLFPPHSFVCRVWCVYQKKNSAHFEPSQHEQFDQQPSSNQAISDGIYFARGFFIAPIEICLLLYWDRNTIINKRNFWTWSQNDKASGGRRKLQCMKSNLQPQLWFHIGIHVYAMLYTRVDI